jgi:hypothetical protein
MKYRHVVDRLSGGYGQFRLWRAENEAAASVIQVVALLAVMAVARYLEARAWHRLPDLWMVGVAFLGFSIAKASVRQELHLAVRLLQLVGLCSTAYLVLRYPLLPVLPGNKAAHWLYLVMWMVWGVSAAAGLASFRYPSLAVLPAAAIRWINMTAGSVTGLPYHGGLDTAPLTAVSVFLVTGLWIWTAFIAASERLPALQAGNRDTVARWYGSAILTFAISIHLANYFWAFVEKMSLHGPILSWLTFNNPVYIAAAALDEGHLTFGGYPFIVHTLMWFLKNTYRVSNAFILCAQGIALFGFLISRRGLLVLLLLFDVMHLAILIAAGANFWPWILLNGCIIAVVTRKDYRSPNWILALASIPFIIHEPGSRLGWYDAGANNTTYFLAEDTAGKRHYLSTNFFGFYSYPIAHVAYGIPAPDNAFPVWVNGGTKEYSIAQAARACDVTKLRRTGYNPPVDIRLKAYVANYVRMAKDLTLQYGVFAYNLYPHHFFMAPGLNREFDSVGIEKIRTVILRRESVCLMLNGDHLTRRVVSSAEVRIPVE